MALVTLSGLVSNIKGSVNGTTFQRSASGLTMRNKPTTVGRGTNAQFNIRNINAQLNYAWSNLTDAQRQVWASFSVFINGTGKTNRQNLSANTGKTQFFAVNFWLLQYGKSILNAPSFVTPEAALIPCPPYFTESDNMMNYVGSLDTTQQILVTRISLPQNLPTKTANTGYRTLVYEQVNGDQQDWANAYLNTFGINLIPNKKYWVSLQVVNFVTGAISPITNALVLYLGPPPPGIGSMIIESTFIVG